MTRPRSLRPLARVGLLALLPAAASSAQPAAGQTPSVEDVLARAGVYVSDFIPTHGPVEADLRRSAEREGGQVRLL